MRSVQLSRRRFLHGLALGTGATALAACVAPGTPAETAESGAADAGGASAEAQIVSIMNWDEITGTPFEIVLDAYRDATGVQVDVQPTPAQDYETRMRTMIAGGTAPDVMRINDDFVRGYT